MPKTITDIVAYANEVLPNRINSTTLTTFIDEEAKAIRHYTPDIAVWSTQTVADQQQYTLPDNINTRDIISFYMSGTTYNATTVISSTIDWREYQLGGYNQRHEGSKYYRATTQGSSAERICISPVPTDVVYYKVSYWDYPNTSNGSTTIIKNDYMVKYLQCKLLARICKVGHYPRIDLANNYEIEAMEALSVLKREREEIENALTPNRISYKAWWS